MGTSPRPVSDELEEALQRLHAFGPEWGESVLTNHGPMAVEVMARHGDVDVIESWVDGYVRRLDEMPSPTARITADGWPEALGDGRRIGDWSAFFVAELAEADWPDVLARWWPRLLPGILAGATHGLIRTAHAVRTLREAGATPNGRVELAYGLAFWAARYRRAPFLITARGATTPADVLAAIPGVAEPAGSIAARMAQFEQLPELVPTAETLQAPSGPAAIPALLGAVVDATVARYASHGQASPVLLVHTATAPNAVLHTLPSLPQSLWEPSASAVWSAVVTLRAAFENPRLPAPVDGSGPDVGDAMADALRHGDEHVIKFTDTALESYARTGDDVALLATARIAGLIDPPNDR